MRTTFVHHPWHVLATWLFCLAAVPASADLLWFDPAIEGQRPGNFAQLATAYDDFIGTPDAVIDFNDLHHGAQLGDQYADPLGVTFEHTSVGRYANLSRVWREGSTYPENITGYDGSYMSDRDLVFTKFDNHLDDTPLTMWFDSPVSQVGAFVGMGVQGNIHSLDVRAFDAAGQLLGANTVLSWLWESKSNKQNYESFFAVRTSAPTISRVEIRNNSQRDFANGLLLDNVAIGRQAGVPEPSSLLLMLVGATLLPRRSRRPFE